MKRIYLIIMAMIAALLAFSAVSADYSFSVPRAETVLEIEPDGSMRVFVEYDFDNHGQKLDYIDIGLPNSNYSLGDIRVTLNGQENPGIKVVKADYEETGLRHGISLEMKDHAIPSGGSATVSVMIPNLRKNLYEASDKTVKGETVAMAGFQFSPNYFSSKFAKGKTAYSFIVVYPDGLSDGDVYYYEPDHWVGNSEPEAWIEEDGRVVYEWYSEDADIHTEYVFGGSFRKDALTGTANITKSSSTEGSGDGFWSDFFAYISCLAVPFVLIWGGVRKIINSSKEMKRERRSYFPPQVKTDGEGIKRGLTAVEAAVLLEVDLERVISMILYGLSKKEVITVTSQEPFNVEIVDPLPENLNDYEKDFIAAMQMPSDKEKKTKMRDSMHRLILSVSKKVEGFSLEETREYYKSICDKAWQQVEAAETPELKSQLLGDNFGWAMLEEKPEKRIEQTFSSYDFYPPRWWWRVDPGYRRPSYSPSFPEPSGGGTTSDDSKRSPSSTPTPMPVLPGAMFVRSITDSAKNLGSSLVGNMSQFKSTVKNRTNPAPAYTPSSSHRHGGGGSSGGSSCACACACDSCACACAGGGR